MKKKYIVPETEITVFETEDIITASGDTVVDLPGSGSNDKFSPIYWKDDVH